MGKFMKCFTWKQTLRKRVLFCALAVLAGAAVVIGVRAYAASSVGSGYQADDRAEKGKPEVAEEEQYAHVIVTDGFELDICGNPRIEGRKVYFYPTNPKDNEVWFKVAVLDESGERIGESGMLKPGEYTEYIEVSQEIKGETAVTLKVIAYEPEEYTSRGSASLETVLYP